MPETKNEPSEILTEAARRMKIGDLLVKAGIISQAQKEDGLRRQAVERKPLGKILIEMGFLSEKDLVRALSKQLGLPRVDIRKMTIMDDTLNLLPENLLLKHQVIPIEKKNNTIKLAMANPLDHAAISDIEFMIGGAVQTVIAIPSHVEEFLEKRVVKKEKEEEPKPETEDYIGGIQIFEKKEEPLDLQRLKTASETPTIIHMMNTILSDALRLSGDFIHIEPRQKDIIVKYRVDGFLRSYKTFPVGSAAAIVYRFKRMGGMDTSIQNHPQHGEVQIRFDKRDFDLHISTLPTLFGEKMVIQVLGENEKFAQIEELGMHPSSLSAYTDLLACSQGVIIISGPNGNGKTTTLYSTLRHLRSDNVNIVTIENPIRYQFPGINQVQINCGDGLVFSDLLHHIVQQDPDIIMVSEVNDPKLAELIAQTSMTGCKVLTSMIERNAVRTVARLATNYIEPFLIASTLEGVVAQRLIRRNCKDCMEKYVPEPEILAGLKIDQMEVSEMQFYRGRGCEKCGSTGYSGRIGIFEILRVNDGIRELILNKRPERELLKAARESGMTTMEENGLYLVLNNITTLEEVLRVLPPGSVNEKKAKGWEKRITSLFDDVIAI